MKRTNWGIIVGLLAVTFYFLPFVFYSKHSIPAVYPDGWHMVWNIWWIKHWLTHSNASLYFSDYLFHPFGTGLQLHTLAEGLGVPMTTIFFSLSPERIFVLTCSLCFLFNFLSFYLLFSTLSKEFRYSFLLAIALTFHPFFLGHLRAGHVQLLAFFHVPLLLWAMVRWISADLSRKKLAASAVVFGLCAYQDLYYLYFCAMLMAIFALMFALFHRRHLLALCNFLLYFGLISGLVALPKIYTVYQAYGTGAYANNRDPDRMTADLSLYAIPGSNQVVSDWLPEKVTKLRVKRHDAETGIYIGYSILALLLLGLFKETRKDFLAFSFVVGSLFFLMLACGSAIEIWGKDLIVSPIFRVLHRSLPLFPSVPLRFFVMGEMLLFAAVAHSLVGAFKSKSKVLLNTLLCIMAIEFIPKPISVSTKEPSPALLRLAADTSVSAVYDARGKVSAMNRQMYHEKKIGLAYIARRPQRAQKKLGNNPFNLWAARGKAFQPKEIKAGWDALGVQAAVIEKADDPQILQRLDSIEWLYRFAEDDQLVVYGLRNPGSVELSPPKL